MDITRENFTPQEKKAYDALLVELTNRVRFCLTNPRDPWETLALARFINSQIAPQDGPDQWRMMVYMAVTDRNKYGLLLLRLMQRVMPQGMAWASNNEELKKAAMTLVERWHRFNPSLSFGEYDRQLDDAETRLRQRCSERAA